MSDSEEFVHRPRRLVRLDGCDDDPALQDYLNGPPPGLYEK